MNHKDVKKELLKDQSTREEYEKLDAQYQIQRQIIALRKEMNLSQADLAKRLGTKQSAISRLEAGEYNPSVEFLARVASSLGKKSDICFY